MLMTFEDVEPRSPIVLTRDEMLAISNEISLKFAPEKTTPTAVEPLPQVFATPPLPDADSPEQLQIEGFSHRQLQAIGDDINRRFAPKVESSIPEITLLPVDPHHLYAYWNAGPNPTTMAAEHKLEQPMTLRIYWRPDAAKEITRSNIWFDIPADNPANKKKIRLPIDDTGYSAALGRLNPDHSLDVLAHSNVVHVPTAPNRKRLTLDPPAHHATDAKEQPSFAVRQLQGVLSAAQQEGAHFPEDWSIKLHPDHSTALPRELAKLYSELMNIFKINRIDAELIPNCAPHAEPEAPPKHASGLGL